jgi:hypothetical protein
MRKLHFVLLKLRLKIMGIWCPKTFLFSLNFVNFKKETWCELRKNCSAFARICTEAKAQRYWVLFLSYFMISAGLTLCWVFITLSQGFHHCDPSSGFLLRLLNRPDTRCKTQRLQGVGSCAGQTLIGEAGKTTYFYSLFPFLLWFVLKE